MKSKKKCHFEIEYFDPADESARRRKTWKFKKRKDAKTWQDELKIVWDQPNAEDFPIRKVCTPKKK